MSVKLTVRLWNCTCGWVANGGPFCGYCGRERITPAGRAALTQEPQT